jgi:hypothetical protein
VFPGRYACTGGGDEMPENYRRKKEKYPDGRKYRMKIEKRITIFIKNEELTFEYGVEKLWNGKNETPMTIDRWGADVNIGFKSGRDLYFSGIPYIFEIFNTSDVPF